MGSAKTKVTRMLIPVTGIMDADELEDYLELRDPRVRNQIAQGRRDYQAGRIRDAAELISELREERKKRVPGNQSE